MRPFKHVATRDESGRPIFQDVLGIDLARFRAPWGEVPVIATTEHERITLFAWHDGSRPQWDSFPREHEPLTSQAVRLDDPNGWNWSRRVSVVCSADAVFLVYKRQRRRAAGDPLQPATLTVDRFQPDGTHLRFIDSFDVPAPVRDGQIGFSVWADVDAERARLLILFAARGRFSLTNRTWTLFLRTLPLDDLQKHARWTLTPIGDGGYDLDARLNGRTLHALYREQAAAERFPPPVAAFDITSGPESDAFYAPLALTTIDLATLDPAALSTEYLPGGEHPQIQSVNPPIITFDREQRTRVRFDTVLPPLPPHHRHIVWEPTRIDKVAIVRLAEGDARGVILSTDASALPRALNAFGPANHLISQDEDGAPGHVMPLGIFPVQILQVGQRRKEIVLDVLHHLEFNALVRSRVRATASGDTLSVTDTSFEVWDIGHAQITATSAVRPDADAENRQFSPIGAAAGTSSDVGLAPSWRLDNTIGGHLVADLKGIPAGLFAYTDMGDGGLRVISAADIAPLPDPPLADDPKTLSPASVTGPRVPGEQWVQLDAVGFVDSGLPGYPVGVGSLSSGKSLASSMEVPIDSLLDAAQEASVDSVNAGGAPIVPLQGMTDAQLGGVDMVREKHASPRVADVAMSDGSTLQVTITPGALIAGVALSFSASAGSLAVSPALWSFVRHTRGLVLPGGPLSPFDPSLMGQTAIIGSFTSPTIVAFPLLGQWRLSVFMPAAPGVALVSGFIELTVQDSAANTTWALHDKLHGAQYAVGNLHTEFLQYLFDYAVDADGTRTTVAISTTTPRATRLRFRADGARQGIVDCAATFVIEASDVRLKGLLGLGFRMPKLRIEMVYGRPFTPGMLMVDRRALDTLSGADLAGNPDDTIARKDPLRHAALGAKPIGDGVLAIDTDAQGHERIDVDITIRPEALITTILAALAIMGASAVVEVIVAALGVAAIGVSVAIAASVAVAAILLVILLLLVVPFIAASEVRKQIKAHLADTQKGLDDLGFIRYAGEGAAEAVARMVFDVAPAQNIAVGPASNDDLIGLDRFRGQSMQIIFVSDGVCRVLLRPDA